MRARLDVEYLREAQHRLDAIGERARRPEPALQSSAARHALEQNEERIFAAQRFPKNSDKWAQRKRRRGLSRKRMEATGTLKGVLTGYFNSAVRFTAYNGVLTWGLRRGRSTAFYAAALADRDRRYRVVKLDRRGRGRIGEIVANYVANGAAA